MLILQDWACLKNFHFCNFRRLMYRRITTLLALATYLVTYGHLPSNVLVCPRFPCEIGTNGNGIIQRVTKQYQCTPSPGYTTVRGTFAWGPFVSAFILSRRTINPSASPLRPIYTVRLCSIRQAYDRPTT